MTTVGNLDGFLDPGESITCTATHTITQADLERRLVTNIATASADGTDSNEDTGHGRPPIQTPALTLDKTADAGDLRRGRRRHHLQLPRHQHRQRHARRPGDGRPTTRPPIDLPGRDHGRQPRRVPGPG